MIKMSRLKTISIIVLATFCMVQAWQVWTGSSLFQSVKNVIDDNANRVTGSYEYDLLTKPSRIFIYSGGDDFTIKYNNFTDIPIVEKLGQVMNQLFKNGEFAAERTEIATNRIDYLNDGETVVVYEYLFNMPSDVFGKAFSYKGNLLTSRMKSFNAAVFMPILETGEVRVVFVDDENKTEYEFTVGNNMAEELAALINETPQHTDKPITLKAAYEMDGETQIMHVRDQVSFLFPNPNAVMWDILGQTRRFTDSRATTVTYSRDHVLEYSYSGIPNGKRENTFISAFSAAVKFLRSDKTLTSEFYLEGYSPNNDVWTFYFGLAVNDFPLLLDKDFAELIGIGHFVEVMVRNDTVANYKRFVYTFDDVKTTGNGRKLTYKKDFGANYLVYSVNAYAVSVNMAELGWVFVSEVSD